MGVSKKYFFLVLFLIWEIVVYANGFKTPNLQNSVLDLREWNFQNKGSIEIGGDVNFYWEEFLSFSNINNNKESCKVSLTSSWNNQKDKNCNFPAKGYGTYSFRIFIPKEDVGKQLILRPNHFIAYSSQIFVNDKMVSHNGFVGTSENDKNYNPSRNTFSDPFIADSTVLDVVIWAANYSHFRGGIFHELKLGLADDMINQRERDITFDLIIIISLFIMFLYHFTIYFVNTKEFASLFFSLTCLVFALDFSFQDTMSFFLVFPNASFHFTSLLHISLPYFIPSSFLFFLYALFPKENSRTIRNISGIITLVLVLITLFNIPDIYSKLVKPHYVYALIIVFYVYYVAVKAVINKREGSRLFLLAYIVFSICAINDILFVLEIVNTANLVSTGLIVFVFLLSILQGRRTAQMTRRNIKLTKYLKEVNLDLGKKVEKRTEELNLSLVKLQKLNEFKEDMTNMIIHDLKTPLSTIINAKELNNDLVGLDIVQQSGYTMLNLVQNVLDVYKYQNIEVELNKSQVELIQIINTAIKEVDFIASHKILDIKISKKINFLVKVDQDIIRRVFVNLLSNAIKFSPVKGTIDIDAIINEDNLLKISVINQGEGIPKEKQKQIFEKFGQAVQKDKQGSTGLGLTFCKMAVEAHKGNIGVISESRMGVEFWLTLPDAQKVEASKHEPNKTNEIGLCLSKEEKEYLIPYINEIKAYQIYEITAINNIIKKIDLKTANISKWIDEFNKLLYSGDELKLKDLTNLE